MENERERCTRRVLAQRGGVILDQCGCGAMHVTVGNTTMRMPRAAAETLCMVLAEGLRETEERAHGLMQ